MKKNENKKIRKSYINCKSETSPSPPIHLSSDLNKALPIPSINESIPKDNLSTESETSDSEKNLNSKEKQNPRKSDDDSIDSETKQYTHFSQNQSQHVEKLLEGSEKNLNSIFKQLNDVNSYLLMLF